MDSSSGEGPVKLLALGELSNFYSLAYFVINLQLLEQTAAAFVGFQSCSYSKKSCTR